jgi:hypothetical protein
MRRCAKGGGKSIDLYAINFNHAMTFHTKIQIGSRPKKKAQCYALHLSGGLSAKLMLNDRNGLRIQGSRP